MATAFLAFGRSLGGIIGSTLGQTILFVVFKQHLAETNLPPGVDYASYINSPDEIRKLPAEERDAVIGAFVKGFQGAMYFALGLFLAAFIMSLFLNNARIPKVDKAASKKKDDAEVKVGQEPEGEPSSSSVEPLTVADEKKEGDVLQHEDSEQEGEIEGNDEEVKL
jgi:hypothetical protein